MIDAVYTLLALVSGHAKLAAVAVVVLCSGLYFSFGRSEERAYNVCSELHAECRRLREAGAGSEKWAEFRSLARQRSNPLIVSLSAKGAGRTELEQHLLESLRLLMQVADVAPQPAEKDEQQLLRHLQVIEARR